MSDNRTGGYFRDPDGSYRLRQPHPPGSFETPRASPAPSDTSEETLRGDSPKTPTIPKAGKKRRRRKSSDEPPVQQKSHPRSLAKNKRRDSVLEVIYIDEEDDHRPIQQNDYDNIIDLDAIGENMEAEVFSEEAPPRNAPSGPPREVQRNIQINCPFHPIDSFKWGSCSLKAGKTLELSNGTFLYIKEVIKHRQRDEIIFRGVLLKRCKNMEGLLPKKINELCFIYDVDLDDERPAPEQGIIEVGLKGDIGLVQIRHMIRTNRPFPEHRFSEELLPEGTRAERTEHIRKNERLVVRWKFISAFSNSRDRVSNGRSPNNFRRRQLEMLDESECSRGHNMPMEERRRLWRGETVLGGSSSTNMSRAAREAPRRSEPVFQQREEEYYECDHCGDDFHLSVELLKHYQACHEPKDQQPSPRAGLRYRNLVVLSDDDDDDDDDDNDNEKNVEAVRHRFSSVFSVGAELQRQNHDDVFIVRKDEKSSLGQIRGCSGPSRAASNPFSAVSKGRLRRSSNRKYTYGDGFCGAGGMTRGAVMAGLKVIWGMDFNTSAGETWAKNFSTAKLYNMWAHELVALPGPDDLFIVDILHLSPPCQVFSPVHTIKGKDDDMNYASLFAIMELIKKTKPRIVTLEQTFGILHKRFRQAFNTVIHMYTALGFSVSWQIVELQRLGLAQRRKRLIIVASCPGEKLPDFPPFTHSENGIGGLKPFVTPHALLSRIPVDAPNHNVNAAFNPRANYKWWDDNKITNTITTDGGENSCHPSGTRGLTYREFAALQGFPNNHIFHAQNIRKQIGNAVPPLVGKILLSWIRKHLEKVDGVTHEADEIID